MYLRSILIATMTAAMALSAAVDMRNVELSDDTNSTSVEKRTEGWVTFYSDPICRDQFGSVSYSTQNQGCFENDAPYLKVGGDDEHWAIEQQACPHNFWATIGIIADVAMDNVSHVQRLHFRLSIGRRAQMAWFPSCRNRGMPRGCRLWL